MIIEWTIYDQYYMKMDMNYEQDIGFNSYYILLTSKE